MSSKWWAVNIGSEHSINLVARLFLVLLFFSSCSYAHFHGCVLLCYNLVFSDYFFNFLGAMVCVVI
jgi:hypothetical protein